MKVDPHHIDTLWSLENPTTLKKNTQKKQQQQQQKKNKESITARPEAKRYRALGSS